MPNSLKIVRKEAAIAPELKDFIDRAVVPILVREFLQKEIAGSDSDVASSNMPSEVAP